jgi:signal peptidase complex subunit 3
MDSYTNRGNTIFSAWTTCLGLFAVLNHITYYFTEPTITGKVDVVHVEDLTLNQQFQADQMNIAMNVQGDFLPELSHWNMKLVFAYIVAEYSTTKNGRNMVTIWDQPVKSLTKSSFALSSVANEYPIRDQFKLLKGRNVTLHFRYRTVPITGWLFTKELSPGSMTAPSKYFRRMDEAKEKERKAPRLEEEEEKEAESKSSKAKKGRKQQAVDSHDEF